MRRALLAFVLVTGGLLRAAAAQDAVADELRKLEGGWQVMAAEQRGKPFDAIRGGGLVIEGRTFTLKTAAGNAFSGEIRVDPSASPKHLDFIHSGGDLVWQAIYAVDEEMLRLNYVEAGEGARPTIFATSSDGPGLVIVMSRMARR